MEACVLHGAHDLRLEQQDDPGLASGEVRIRVRNGGICGLDLHYYHQGRVGDFVIREPLVPGHEFSGEVAETGPGVTSIRTGDRVAVHPGRSCGQCVRCREGRRNLCQNVFFMGSASKFLHMQGGFRERVVVREEQCFPVAGDAGFDELAFAEPLAVCLHAGLRAGNLAGRSVLVTGGGSIGQLLVLVARNGGASHVALTDIVAASLAMAQRIGADDAMDVSDPAALAEGTTIQRYDDDASTSQAMLAGQVEGIVTSGGLATAMIGRNADLANQFIVAAAPMGIGVRLGEADMLHWLNTDIFMLWTTGELPALQKKWMGAANTDLPRF